MSQWLWTRLWDDLPTRISLLGAAFYLLVIIGFCFIAALTTRREFRELRAFVAAQRAKRVVESVEERAA